MSSINAPHFTNEQAAREYLESILWPSGITCPHCGTIGKAYTTKRSTYRCSEKGCRKDFTVTVGTIYERSHIPLHKWLLASYLLCSSKKGISSHQLHRTLGVTYKTALFMTHRIREAMKPSNPVLLGGKGKTVEADETFIGNKGKQAPGARSYHHKEKILSLVERGGHVRSQHIPAVNAETLRPILNEQIAAETRLITDEARHYKPIGKDFAEHHSVNHSIGEYVRGDIHSNTVENYFSIFKRGMKGVYQHCSEQHLKRYLAEFDFRYNNREALDIDDMTRSIIAIKGAKGKRLTYRKPIEKADIF